jgi:hypothetical protein
MRVARTLDFDLFSDDVVDKITCLFSDAPKSRAESSSDCVPSTNARIHAS